MQEDSEKNITKMKVKHYFEVGNVQHRLHIHGLRSVKHTGNYRMHSEEVLVDKKVHLNIVGSTGD